MPKRPPRHRASQARWTTRVRRWATAYAAWDERLYEQLQSSRASTWAVLVVVWALLAFLTPLACAVRRRALGSLAPSDVVKVVAVAAAVGVTATCVARHRLRTQLLDERRKAGRCLSCGYDLRESPGRCPECGRVDPVGDEPVVGEMPAASRRIVVLKTLVAVIAGPIAIWLFFQALWLLVATSYWITYGKWPAWHAPWGW